MTNDKDLGGAFVMPAQAFREGVRWRERQNNNGIVSDQYLAEHNPYRDDEPTVQVPVSLPTREQIAEMIEVIHDECGDDYDAMADAVLDLFQNGADRG